MKHGRQSNGHRLISCRFADYILGEIIHLIACHPIVSKQFFRLFRNDYLQQWPTHGAKNARFFKIFFLGGYEGWVRLSNLYLFSVVFFYFLLSISRFSRFVVHNRTGASLSLSRELLYFARQKTEK